MGDIYHAGSTYAGSVPIDDTQATASNTWSAQKIDNEINELSDTYNTILNDVGAKNLCPNKGITQTIKGVTFTVNSDGTVTANGTANGTAVFYCISNALFKKGTYVVNGTPDGGDYSNTYALAVSIHATGSTIATDAAHPSLTDTFIVTNETEEYILSIIVRSGQTVSNLIFKPMIRPASIADNTYVPYAMTNRELTKKIIVEEGVTLTSNSSGFLTIPQKDGYVVTSVMTYHPSGSDTIWGYARRNTLALLTNLSGTPITNTTGIFTIVYTRI